MVHRPMTLLALLFLGALLTTANAWLCAYRGCFPHFPIGLRPSQRDSVHRSWTERPEWPSYAPSRWTDRVPAGYSVTTTPTCTSREWMWTSRGADDIGPIAGTEVLSVTELRAGWPLRSLDTSEAREAVVNNGRPPPLDLGWWRKGLDLPESWSLGERVSRRLPLRPVWPGFGVNTLVYGGATWVMLLAVQQGNRLRRASHAQCPTCGYPVVGLQTCPECGSAIQRNQT